MSTDLQLTVSQEQGRVPVTVLKIKGKIDSDNFTQLQDKAQEAYDDGMRYLLIDFSEVPYMSSAGLRAIHAIYKMLQGDESEPDSQEGEFKSPYLKLLNPPDKIRQLINVVGFDRYVEIHTDLQEAIDSF